MAARIVSINADLFLSAINREIAAATSHVMAGGCSDFAEYRAKAGQVKGLNRSIEIFKQTVNGDEDNDG